VSFKVVYRVSSPWLIAHLAVPLLVLVHKQVVTVDRPDAAGATLDELAGRLHPVPTEPPAGLVELEWRCVSTRAGRATGREHPDARPVTR
jgi:hypothetical protein